jgi:hypothetical protein
MKQKFFYKKEGFHLSQKKKVRIFALRSLKKWRSAAKKQRRNVCNVFGLRAKQEFFERITYQLK